MSDKARLSGPKPLKYFHKPTARLEWYRLAAEEVPKPWVDYYHVVYRRRHVADVFHGKSGRWFAVVFDRATFAIRDHKDIGLHVTGLVCGFTA